MVQKLYKCAVSRYVLEFDVQNEYADMGAVICDYQNILSFVQLLRAAVDDMTLLGVKYICQTIFKSDEIFLVETTWEKYVSANKNLSVDENYVQIVCKIEDFIKNMDKSLGLTL